MPKCKSKNTQPLFRFTRVAELKKVQERLASLEKITMEKLKIKP
jgi:hypothetical protein